MTVYNPDSWVILEIKDESLDKPIYKVLAGWSGGYLDGDSWKINSGITDITHFDDYYDITGHSGSVYECRRTGNASSLRTGNTMRMSMQGIYNRIKEKFGDNVKIVNVEDIVL